ncbi:piggyBac transposable element-derived protein 4-like [Mizuhopecten yessoensis]|uniref:piggyBac transposable element-derived protein 4-like n=1 Tax=Mizuhopecten yessoensis TaxID=6573 RepID=UPI000B459F34|nr:piggyBac transposable element-derived protein 4-like [Mizuhopecten yessoensis]
MVQYYDVFRKTVKWWRKLFLHLFNLLLVNAVILHRKYGNNTKKGCHLKFRKSLVHVLLEGAEKKTRRGRQSEPLGRLTGRHFPAFIPAKQGAKRARPLRNCVAYNVKGAGDNHKRKQTSYMCVDCGVALCVPDCFSTYHTYTNYRRVLNPIPENQDVSDTDSDE